MSVLIRGMEKPDDCGKCPFLNLNGEFCQFARVDAVPEDCPLVEVQPHGRLVDADELKEEITEEAINLRMNGLKGTPRSTENHRWAIDRLDEAPTIIEAEGSEEPT